MRVGIIALQHESNTFSSEPTTLKNFQQGALLTGAAIREHYAASHHEVGGFFAGLQEAGADAVPIFMAWALPGGIVTARTLEDLLSRMLAELKAAGPLDGLLVAPHGAGVSEHSPDMDGAWLRELRSRVGPQVPIVGTLDLHANLTETMVRATDALIGYRTNPHLDQRQRGIEAARLIVRMIRGQVRPTQAAAFPPLAINIERQSTGSSPCRQCYEALGDIASDQRVLSASLLLGFPYADVRELGTSVIIVTDDEPDLAHSLAEDFAEYLRHQRASFQGQLIEVSAAIEQLAHRPGPVCLLDMGDNIGGGSPGDGTELLRALVEADIAQAFACLHDPEAVAVVRQAAVGTTLPLAIGGKADNLHGQPLTVEARVVGLFAGKFHESAARHGGRTEYDMGPTAVVELSGGQTVMLTSQRIAPFSLGQLTSCGIDPARFQAIVAKGVHAPVAAYAPVCPTLLRVNTPGITCADMSRLDYKNRRRPLYPLEEI